MTSALIEWMAKIVGSYRARQLLVDAELAASEKAYAEIMPSRVSTIIRRANRWPLVAISFRGNAP